ncbi:MAG: shikimate dehydrogenase [Nitrospiraceae bacterium]|nr:shikimate dehydrogenase [Nitrospiraceae bacterium]
MNISGRTKVTGILGYPVEQTLSPAMQNAAFAYLDLDYCYLPFLVRPDSLGRAVEGLRALNVAGVNVTVPHKEAVIPFLDGISDEAAFIGAVNTVVNRDGMLHGDNTDGRGFMRSLSERGIDPSGRKVLVIGAGGASRAVSYYLSEKAAELAIYNRGRDRLERLVSDLSGIRTNVRAAGTPEEAGAYDIIVNATSLGLRPGDPMPFDPSGLSGRQVVCDLIYRETPILAAAAAAGCSTLNGLGMLLYQGVLAFEIWTSKAAPVEIMKNALLASVGR